MVGKKDMCPVCNEKVDLKSLYVDRPWETRNLTWYEGGWEEVGTGQGGELDFGGGGELNYYAGARRCRSTL